MNLLKFLNLLNIESFIIIFILWKKNGLVRKSTLMRDKLDFLARVENAGQISPICILQAKCRRTQEFIFYY